MRRDACLFLVVALISTAAQAARPLTVDDAAPVGKGQFQLMTGVLYKSDSSMALWDTPSTLGTGLGGDATDVIATTGLTWNF